MILGVSHFRSPEVIRAAEHGIFTNGETLRFLFEAIYDGTPELLNCSPLPRI
jgi:hypothetical protein